MAIANALEKTDISQDRNRVVAVGLADDGGTLRAYCEVSEDDGGTTDEGPTAIAAADDVTPSVQILTTGEIIATIVASGLVTTYMSGDWGRTWAAV